MKNKNTSGGRVRLSRNNKSRLTNSLEKKGIIFAHDEPTRSASRRVPPTLDASQSTLQLLDAQQVTPVSHTETLANDTDTTRTTD